LAETSELQESPLCQTLLVSQFYITIFVCDIAFLGRQALLAKLVFIVIDIIVKNNLTTKRV